MAQKIVEQIEKLLADLRVELSGASPNEIKLNKKKAELAELENKVKSKSPDKDEEKKVKLREQIAKLEAPKPAKGKKKSDDTDDEDKPVKVKKSKDTDDEDKPVKAKKSKKSDDTEDEDKPVKAKKSKKSDDTEDEDKPKEKPKAKEEKETRVIKLTGPLLDSFKKAMEDNGLDVNADSKKAFTVYANSLSSDDYAAEKLEVHMKNFATKPTVVTVAQLHQSNSDLEEISAGLYRNKKTKALLTGPPELEDEEFDDANVDEVEYVLGNKTKRVYRTNPDGPDVFVGYWGVGKFYDSDM